MLRSIKVWSKWTKTLENVTCRVSCQYWSLHRYITLSKRRSLALFFAGLCQRIHYGSKSQPVDPTRRSHRGGACCQQRKDHRKKQRGLLPCGPLNFTGRLFNTTYIGEIKLDANVWDSFLSDLCGIWCIVWVGVIIVMTPCFYVRIPSNSQFSSGWGHSFSESNEQWKKAWLFRVFKGLYYPVQLCGDYNNPL